MTSRMIRTVGPGSTEAERARRRSPPLRAQRGEGAGGAPPHLPPRGGGRGGAFAARSHPPLPACGRPLPAMRQCALRQVRNRRPPVEDPIRRAGRRLHPPLQGEGRLSGAKAGWGEPAMPAARARGDGTGTPPRRPAVADPPPAGEGEDVPRPLRTGDNSSLVALAGQPQPADLPRLSRLLTETCAALSPHPPNLLHPGPTFRPHRGIVRWCGRWGGGAVPLCVGSPARAPGRRRDHRPFGPLRRCRAGGDRCARSIARVGARDRRGFWPCRGQKGRGGRPRLPASLARAVAGPATLPRPGRRRDPLAGLSSRIRRPGRAAR